MLLNKSEEYRRNEMVMLEEFRRRKNLKDYFDLSKSRLSNEHEKAGVKEKLY